MASVSNLDQDVRRLRLDRYTPSAVNEVRGWIEESLGEKITPGDLMEVLRDGVILCRLINLCISPGVRYKPSSMPFVQMENISHFLKACELPPLSLPAHDRFLTVDLFDQKDPAQVLQCIAAFSRRANQVNPSSFPTTIGAKSKGGAMSPENTGASGGYAINTPPKYEPQTAFNPLNKAAYSASGRTSPTKTSSLSRGGLATGGPVSSWSRQSDESSTAPAWNIHQYGYMGGATQGNQGVAFGARRQIVSASPDIPSVAEKEKRLKEQAARQQREIVEEQQGRDSATEREEAEEREAEEKRWEEETRRLEDQHRRALPETPARLESNRQAQEPREHLLKEPGISQQRDEGDIQLRGQFLSQYRASQENHPKPEETQKTDVKPVPARPLPDPSNTLSYQPNTNRTDRYLAKNPAPASASVRSNRPADFSTTTEVDLENQRRVASQAQTKAGGWASKSLLEREMERERERQREWEENQKDTVTRAKDLQEGAGPGQSWDVHQYGYIGGDNQNRGGVGLGTSGARRQIIGPRPPP